MPSVTVNITPEVISWVMNHAKVEDINSSLYEKMLKWKNGEKVPTFNQVEDVSRATNIPLGYFFLQNPPVEELAILEYRTIDSYFTSNPSRNLIDTINNMESIQEWMKDYLIKSDNAELNYVGSMKSNRNSKIIAENIREILGLEKNWYSFCTDSSESFRVIRRKLENAGIVVMVNGIVGQNTHRKLSIEEFRAFTLLNNYAPLIFVNSNDSKNGKLFSLLHETAHIWIGVSNFYNDRYSNAVNVGQEEIICNSVAAEILVPNEIFINQWNGLANKPAYEKIKKLASIFRCGTTVIARRALDNGYIVSDIYNRIAEEAIKHYMENEENKSSSGGDYYVTAASRYDNRFLIALDNSIHEGKTQFTDAYRLTNTNRKTFSKLVDKVRGIDR